MHAYTNIKFMESEFPLVLFSLMLVLLSVVQRCKCWFHAVEYQEYGSRASLDNPYVINREDVGYKRR
jgi:hypothetical protein